MMSDPQTETKPDVEVKKKKGKNVNTSKRGRKQNKGMIEVEPVIGTRDFYPEDMRLRKWLFNNFHNIANQFCFQV